MARKKAHKSFMEKMTWLIVFTVLSMILVAAVDFKMKMMVDQLNVEIIPLQSSKNLITKKEIVDLIRNHQGYDLEMANIKEINLKEYEELLNSVKFVKKAEVYIDAKNRINVIVTQREPIVRISSGDQQYYLDADGSYVPFSHNGTVRVPVATGNLGKYRENYLDGRRNALRDVFEMSQKIKHDPFLHALVEQIHVEQNGEMVLIPKIGREKILFGYTDRMDEKFENLKIFYKNALPTEGWNKFKYLNLKWENQVVGGM